MVLPPVIATACVGVVLYIVVFTALTTIGNKHTIYILHWEKKQKNTGTGNWDDKPMNFAVK